MVLTLLLAFLLATAPCPAISRSQNILRAFQRVHPCPSTGKPTGPCPGWVKDHIYPLCAGGKDSIENLVWSPVEEAKLKDQWERKLCQRLGCQHRGGD